jgi:hypothetical protein
MKVMSRRSRPALITLYNYVSATSSVATYQRTYIQRVSLDLAYQMKLAQRGVSTTNTAALMIDLRDITTTSNRTFMTYEAWAALTTKTGYFTFNTANDFFVVGEAAETMPTTTKAEMLAKYRCYSITGVSIPASDRGVPIILSVTSK